MIETKKSLQITVHRCRGWTPAEALGHGTDTVNASCCGDSWIDQGLRCVYKLYSLVFGELVLQQSYVVGRTKSRFQASSELLGEDVVSAPLDHREFISTAHGQLVVTASVEVKQRLVKLQGDKEASKCTWVRFGSIKGINRTKKSATRRLSLFLDVLMHHFGRESQSDSHFCYSVWFWPSFSPQLIHFYFSLVQFKSSFNPVLNRF